MAPRKEKATTTEASDMILHYLRKTNRPYSAIDVSSNLHNKVTKAATVKLLKDLQEQKVVECRVSGKQVVYHASQNPADAMTADQLATYDARTQALESRTTELHTLAKTLRATLTSLTGSLSTADLISGISSLEREKAGITARLDGLRAGHARKVTKEEREAVEREWRVAKGVCERRERIAREFWKVVEEGTESEEACGELREMWGLDE